MSEDCTEEMMELKARVTNLEDLVDELFGALGKLGEAFYGEDLQAAGNVIDEYVSAPDPELNRNADFTSE